MLEPNKEDKKSLAEQRRSGPAVGFGTSFAVGMALFALGGHWLDGKTGREPLFTLLGIGLGLLYGAWELWKLITMTNQQAEDRKRNQSDDNESAPNDPPK
jgi:hypothetical protein